MGGCRLGAAAQERSSEVDAGDAVEAALDLDDVMDRQKTAEGHPSVRSSLLCGGRMSSFTVSAGRRL